MEHVKYSFPIKCVMVVAFLFSGLVTKAQLVAVPDPVLRAWMNTQAPGCINLATEELDTAHPGLPGVRVAEFTNTGIADLTGLAYFTGLERISIHNAQQMVVAPAWPAALDTLYIVGADQLTALPAFPASLVYILLDHMDGLQTLPVLPDDLLFLSIRNMAGLQAFPAFPDGLPWLVAVGVPLITSLPPLPTSCDLLTLGGMPALTDTITLPEGLTFLQLVLDAPVVSEFPDEITHLILGVGATDLPPLPSSLFQLEVQSPTLTTLPALPEGLNYLLVGHSPLFSSLPAIPGSLVALHLSHLPGLSQVPYLPTGTQTIEATYLSPDLCLHNMPAGASYWDALIEDEFPLYGSPRICSGTDYSGVQGVTYLDADGNGVQDVNEGAIDLITVEIQPGGFITSADQLGNYFHALDPGTYTITPVMDLPVITGVSPAQHVATLVQISDVDSLNDFGITTLAEAVDLRIGMAATPARPGFSNTVWLYCRNVGSMPINAQVDLAFDADQSWVTSEPLPTTQSGNSAGWSFMNMSIGELRVIQIQLHTDAGVPIGADVEHMASIGPIAADIFPADNSATCEGVVIGAFDPNDIAVHPEVISPAQVLLGERLEYTIRFQNTGTAAAERVLITTVLSPDLIHGSLQFMASSHACTWFVHDGQLNVLFDPILLPDSISDEPASHGFVKFSIKPVQSLLIGDEVGATAHIYFDYNVAVVTNEALFIVDAATATVGMNKPSAIHVQPNPVVDRLIVVVGEELTGDDVHLDVFDATGRNVIQHRPTTARIELQVGDLPGGLYVVRVTGPKGRVQGRFMKQ